MKRDHLPGCQCPVCSHGVGCQCAACTVHIWGANDKVYVGSSEINAHMKSLKITTASAAAAFGGMASAYSAMGSASVIVGSGMVGSVPLTPVEKPTLAHRRTENPEFWVGAICDLYAENKLEDWEFEAMLHVALRGTIPEHPDLPLFEPPRKDA